MKIQRLFLLMVILIGMINCKKDENVNITTGINFCTDEQVSDLIVNYDEIIGYDSTKYAYVLDEFAWEKINKKIMEANLYVYPFPDFVINITLNNNLIYRAGYVPSLSSTADFGRIIFKLQEPDIIYFQIEPPIEMFMGEDLRNDLRLIEQLKKDNKIVEIED